MLTDPASTNDVTRDIIGCSIKVHKALGPGLLESAYTPCLALELMESAHAVELRKPVPLVCRSVTLDVLLASRSDAFRSASSSSFVFVRFVPSC